MDYKLIIISSFSCLLAGMGMGGGSLFIIAGMFFLEISQKDLQGLNLIMFIISGSIATINNFKNKMIDKTLVKKIIPGLIIGSIVGTYFATIINENKLRKYFLIFITIIGIYEIISSLINIKKAKNNNNENKIRKERII
ncbi:MAG: sulfite exporter TauE/SafE family protein [Clostridia bacterium]|nr:sulfite exporter TauE/SafE family protein [Clostridia bacterium]